MDWPKLKHDKSDCKKSRGHIEKSEKSSEERDFTKQQRFLITGEPYIVILYTSFR